jgi:hypothetical protein
MQLIDKNDPYIKFGAFLFIISLAMVFLAACATNQPQALPNQVLLPTINNTNTPTSTIVWFPATATYTPLPTKVVTPTVDVNPLYGEIILQDDFTDPASWSLNHTSTSSIALGDKEITLAVSQPGLYLFTLRKSPVLTDFYLEVTAAPSLCAGQDEYGILFRVSPSLDFYRYSLSCDGQIRLDKYLKNRASSPQPKTFSGSVPPGAPSSSRLAIWASGKELRFYANGEYQFTVNDPSIRSGTLGLFARSEAENAVTISFSNLVIYQIAQ